MVSYEDMGGLHHCSVITSRSVVQEKGDPRAYTVPYTIGSCRFSKSLCDLGVSINLIPQIVFKYLGLKLQKIMTVR